MRRYLTARDRVVCSIGLSLPVLYSVCDVLSAIVVAASGVIKIKLSETTRASRV